MQRSIPRYDPFADAADRWPQWTITFSDLAGIPAVYSASRKTIVLDRGVWAGRECEAVAQAVAHLDLDHLITAGSVTPEQRARGQWLAGVRQDAKSEWPDIDGDPTAPHPYGG